MPKQAVLYGFALAVTSGLLLYMSPGLMSLAFVAIAVAVAVVAFVFGIYRVDRCNEALARATREIHRAQSVQTSEPWLAVRQVSRLFGYGMLDRSFERYRSDLDAARAAGDTILPDVEDYVNDETIGLKTWRNVILQVPSILTGIGILGTFIGLIVGVGGVGFSTVTAAINGVETLLHGIEIAFYTSIAGLILSIMFNLFYRLAWNVMTRNLLRFTRDFQSAIVPSIEAQEAASRESYRREVIALLSGNASAEVAR